MKMYVVAEEECQDEDSAGAGAIVILSSNWLTPKKSEAFWPTAKNQAIFNKLLKNHESPSEDWTLISLKRKFYESDDILIARQKAREAEYTSDITDGETTLAKNGPSKRRKKINKIASSSEDEDVFLFHSLKEKKKLFNNSETLETTVQTDWRVESQPKSDLPHTQIQNFESPTTKTSLQYKTIQEKTQRPPTNTSNLEKIYTTSSTVPLEKSPRQPTTASIPEKIYTTSSIPEKIYTTSSIPEKIYTTSSTVPLENVLGFEAKKTMHMLSTIVEQNNQILNWIRGQNELEAIKTRNIPIDLPVTLPLLEEEELKIIENHLICDNNFAEFCNYLIAFCANSTAASINQILKHCLTNNLASKFSYRGKKGKKAFEELNLKSAIIRVVKKQFKLTTEKELENDIKVWLKHAPQRLKKDLAKKKE